MGIIVKKNIFFLNHYLLSYIHFYLSMEMTAAVAASMLISQTFLKWTPQLFFSFNIATCANSQLFPLERSHGDATGDRFTRRTVTPPPACNHLRLTFKLRNAKSLTGGHQTRKSLHLQRMEHLMVHPEHCGTGQELPKLMVGGMQPRVELNQKQMRSPCWLRLLQ